MPITIRNYGHYWSRDLVNWGGRGRGRAGDLSGYIKLNRRPRVTDFRNQIGIYVLFSGNREVVYLGQTGASDHRLFLRLRDHTTDHLRDRWSNFSWFGFRRVNADGSLSDAQHPDARIQGNAGQALDEIEAVLLQLFEPRLNKQGPRWGDALEFLQYVPSEFQNEIVTFEDRVADSLNRIEQLLDVRSEGRD